MRTEDGELIRKCLNGDPTAFGFLVDKYKGCVYASAYSKLGSFEDAEDLTQEVFLRAYQNLRALKRYDRFLAWLYAITSNLCKNFWRDDLKRPDRESVEEIEPETLDNPSMDAYQQQRKYQWLHAALEALPEKYRQVLTLHYLGGLKSREIVNFLGTSKNTIDSRLRRAKSLLKEEMLTTMETAYDKLHPSFTFRLVELIKRTKIHPLPQSTPLPFGLSVSAGLILALFSLTMSISPLYPIGQWIGAALPTDSQITAVGEISADVVQISEITILSGENADGDFGQKPFLYASQHSDLENQEEEKKMVLKAVQPIPGDSTVIGTFYPTLKAAGEDWSVARLQGTFGHAFSFSMKRGGEEVWQQANIDWWLFWDMLEAIGYEFDQFEIYHEGPRATLGPQEIQEIKERTWLSVKASIDRGIPAIAWQPMTVEQRESGINIYEWALLVGYDEAHKTYTVRHQNYKTDYTVGYDRFGHTDSNGWYYVIVLKEAAPVEKQAVAIRSLENAVAFAHGKRYDRTEAAYDVDAVGFTAYALWREAFESGKMSPGRAVEHAWILPELRRNAATYLREITTHFPETSSRALSEAASFYQAEVGALAELLEICKSAKKQSNFTPAMTQEAITVLDVVLDLERKAIAKIEAALKALPDAQHDSF